MPDVSLAREKTGAVLLDKLNCSIMHVVVGVVVVVGLELALALALSCLATIFMMYICLSHWCSVLPTLLGVFNKNILHCYPVKHFLVVLYICGWKIWIILHVVIC